MTYYRLLIFFLFFSISTFSQKLVTIELGKSRVSYSEKDLIKKWEGLDKIEIIKHTEKFNYLVFHFNEYPPKTVLIKNLSDRTNSRINYTSLDGNVTIALSKINGLQHVLVGLYHKKGEKPYHFSSHSLKEIYGENVKYHY